MKNKLVDLNNHLFAQLERLGDEGLKGDALEEEVGRSKAISQISKDVVSNASLALKAEQFKAEYGFNQDKAMPKMLEVN